MRQLLLGAALLGLVGCTETPPKPPMKASQPAETIEEPVEASLEEEPPTVVEENGGEEAADYSPAVSVNRLVLFTPAGPLLIDLSILIDDEDQAESVDGFRQALVHVFDANNDGVPRWSELADQKVRDRLRMLGLEGPGEESAEDTRRFYDSDGDGRIDPDEATTWVERNAPVEQPRLQLTVLGRRAFAPDPRAAPTWSILDTDEDGSLAQDEIAAAAKALYAQDANDDLTVGAQELLSLEDLLIRRESLLGIDSQATRRGAEYRAGFVLRTPRDTLDVRDAFALLRVGQDYVDRKAFERAGPLFDRIDIDSSGFLLNTEWESLLAIPATLSCNVAFVGGETAGLSMEAQNPGDMEPQIAVKSGVNAAYELILPQGTIGISVTDSQPAIDTAFDRLTEAAEEGPLDSERFQSLEDNNRYDDFDLLDLDGNDLLTTEELITARCLAAGLQRLAVAVTVSAGEDPLLQTLDTDQDGRLGEQEIAQSGALLGRLAGEDGVLQPSEAPWRVRMTIHRGPAGQTPTDAISSPRGEKDAPVWFRGADHNGDGVISRAEHIGPAAAFDRLDQNTDGFVTVDEARAATPQD